MHNTFLSEVAERLYSRHGNEIQKLTIVFPSRRARLFFSDALSRISEQGAIWQPNYMSIDEIMTEASSYELGDKIRILSELYNIYLTHHNESFDKFYHWGELLLSDFDLIDKYMIDAEMLFSNISDLKEIESDTSYLTPEMIEVINRFWSHFENEESLSAYKSRFLKIWKSLLDIYRSLHQRLSELNFAYQGMIYRSAAENLGQGKVLFNKQRHYVFVGFNALSECEKRVLRFIKTNYPCDFYWDYDSYYTSNDEQEAGRFLRENISEFAATDEVSHDNFLNINKKISSISTVSNITQCKYVNTILREISPELKFDKQTAIVLTDENLLIPLLHSLPVDSGRDDDGSIQLNVTMGYPIRQTSVYSFLMRLFELQRNGYIKDGKATFYHIDVMGILNHPFVEEQEGDLAEKLRRQIIDEHLIRVDSTLFEDSLLLSEIFTYTNNWKELYNYIVRIIDSFTLLEEDYDNTRSLKLAYMSILSENVKQVSNSIKTCDIDISTSTYTSLLKRHLQNVRIPFSGEPLQGLQIMGILETRNLDFKNVIILSMNDDNFPGNLVGNNSFIPYNLRAAYGMPTPEHHEGVYAYYFYRLIQRAERVDMLYCSRADNQTTGERSRYIYQLEFESPYKLQQHKIGVNITADKTKPIIIEKKGAVLERLQRMLNDQDRILSPSSFSNYIKCPLRFYFNSIANIKSSDTISEEVDSPMFGTILHAAAEELYSEIIGVANPKEQLQQMLKGNKIEYAVRKAINDNYLKQKNYDAKDYSGTLILVEKAVVNYLSTKIIPYDIAHCDFAVQSLEEKIKYPISLSDGSQLYIGGTADRIDSMDDGTLRIIDYKTGAGHDSQSKKPFTHINGVEYMFSKESPRTYALQTMLYSMIMYHKLHRDIRPSLYMVQDMGKEEYSPYIYDCDASLDEVKYAKYKKDFESILRQTIEELFNPNIPFVQCEQGDKSCEYCDYKKLCKR